MNFKQIEAFVKLVATGSFSSTAKELFLTQPTITSHIKLLEEELGVRLFIRNTRGIKLTKDGERLYIYARDIMKIVEDINNEFKKEEVEIPHNLVIASSSVPSAYIVPKIISKFVKQNPATKFTVKETDSSGVIDEVKAKRVDIGFTGSIIDRSNCVYIPFYDDNLRVIMPNTKEYREICEKEKDFMWMRTCPIIARENGSGTKKETEKTLKKYFEDLRCLNIVANIDNTDGIIRMVKNGMGISIVSELAIKEYIDNDEILVFPKEFASRKFYMVYNSLVQISNSIKLLINLVQSLYKM